MDENEQKKVDKAMRDTGGKFQDAIDKIQKAKNIKVTVAIMVVKTIAVMMIVFGVLIALAVVAGALKHIKLDEHAKTTTAKSAAIGEEPLDTILELDENAKKYKIAYDGQTGKDAIRAILEDNDMNFEDYTEEELECLYRCLKAEWATTYPNLGEAVDNTDIDSEYVQGVITIKRGMSDGNPKNLTYKPYEEFSGIKDSTALDYFSMKDGNLVVASWSSIETKYAISGTMPEELKNLYVDTGEQININETQINYRSMIGVHTIPFEFLWGLLGETEDIDFVNELADLAFNSTIEITVYDNTTETTSIQEELTTEITTYIKEAKWNRWKRIKKTDASGTVMGVNDTYHTGGNVKIESSDVDKGEYTVTTTTIEKSNSYSIALSHVDSWLAKIENIYSYSPTTRNEDFGEGEPYEYEKKFDPETIDNTDSELQAELQKISNTYTPPANITMTDAEGITSETTYSHNLSDATRTGTLNGTKKITKNINQINEYKYEKNPTQTLNVGDKFKEVYDVHPKTQAQLDIISSWLFELLEETESSVDYVSIMKYLLYICTGEDYGVRELDLDLFKQEEFTFVGTVQGDNAYHAFLLAWEGTRKDEAGNFILHRPDDVTIGYGLYLGYNLELFQELGYFKTLDQSTWEKLYEIRRQRVVNKEDLKFYNYELENGNLVRKQQIPNGDIEQASENSRNNFRESVEKEVKFNLSSNQYEALAVIKYKWGNIGNFNDVYHYYEEGDKDAFLSNFIVSGTHPMKKEKDFSERQYAAWMLFDEGKYFDRSGNLIVVASGTSQESRSFLDVAKERHDYIRTNNYTYVQGTTIPADASKSKGIDCSAYVSDVIYWYGYYNGYQKYIDTFKGHQHVSSWFMSKSNIESLGWKQLDISQVQAGDIIVKDGHVEIYAGDGKCYNAGSSDAIKKEYTNPGINYVKGFKYAIRVIPPNTSNNLSVSGNYKEIKNGRQIAEYGRNQQFYQGANQSKWGDSCLGFSIVYGTAIKNNDQSLITKNKSSLTGNSPVGTTWPKSITNDNKQQVLANVYDQINAGKPCIIQVNGNTQGTSRHYVVVIGYKTSVTSRDAIKETDLLIIDVWDAKVEEVGTKGSGKRFMISGWDTGRKGLDGYGYQVYILN